MYDIKRKRSKFEEREGDWRDRVILLKHVVHAGHVRQET